MTDNSGFVARLRYDASIFDRTELRTNMLVAADLVESLTAERDVLRLENDRLLNHISRRIVRDSIERAEDDFGDASISRAMAVARERGEDIDNMPNPSRLIPYETDEGVVVAVDLDGTIHRANWEDAG